MMYPKSPQNVIDDVSSDYMFELKNDLEAMKHKEMEQAIKSAILQVEVDQLKIRLKEKDTQIAWYQQIVEHHIATSSTTSVLPSYEEEVQEEDNSEKEEEEIETPKKNISKRGKSPAKYKTKATTEKINKAEVTPVRTQPDRKKTIPKNSEIKYKDKSKKI